MIELPTTAEEYTKTHFPELVCDEEFISHVTVAGIIIVDYSVL